MKKYLFFLMAVSFIFISNTNLNAQRWKLMRYEVMLGVASTNYFGDIGGAADENNWFGIRDIELNHTLPSYNLGIRYKTQPRVSVKFNFLYGNIKGDDVGSKNEERALSFTGRIIEPSFRYEYYFIPEERRNRSNAIFNKRGMINNYSTMSAYVFGGLGGVIYNAELSGDLSTRTPEEYTNEGSFALSVPIGVGAKFFIDQHLIIGLEFSGHWTSTDYLDGFNSRFAANTSNDIFYVTGLEIIYRLQNDRRGRPSFRRSPY